MTDNPSGPPNAYMERTRLYYRALGYEKDYIWASRDEIPFARLSKPLSKASPQGASDGMGGAPRGALFTVGQCLTDRLLQPE